MVLAAIIIGVVWAAWHWVALVQADRSAEWIFWWTLWTVALRILMVWLYNTSGESVFGISAFHAMTNVSWQIYPVQGSYFDPEVAALVAGVVAVPIVVRTVLSPKSRQRRGR